MSREYPQFKLRMPPETRDKLKARADMNGRSVNAELLQIIDDALSVPSSVSGYRNDRERLADHQAEEVKKMVFSTLMELYDKDNK
ncbi:MULTISPECIES: Arc family DNA-binding protein [Providencia]|uniref:Arc family DNA-binding protein n=1 Tax=Providencia TaxID=586 RepID=UPI0015EC5279|nr:MULTISPECIES: Arc family DNA-binding protein [Providencia]ELT5688946.1 Arc family DNA-binding protein [Providencia rettgeri]QLQ63884.1 Arc family DNA-binding protein [Providencia rettgeri]QPE18794.1 Arc family DNA-binding protein [Providencia rettgeri]URR23995.1 Arc family DNA-binding protein [Providencia rettgeri]